MLITRAVRGSRSTISFRRARSYLLSLLAAGVVAPSAHAVLLIGLNGALYKQDFNSIPTSGTINTESSLPQGWTFIETGAASSITFSADDGTASGANTYSYGTTGNTDRAFGELTGVGVNSTIGAGFINRTGLAITRLTVGYTGEQWRLGAADANVDRLDFQISFNATSLTDGAWADVNTLDFVSPNNSGATGAKDGNNAANRTVFPDVVASTSVIPNLGTFWVRWTSTDITGADDGLAIDDFVLRTNPIADFDLDGDVDGADYLRLQRNFGTASGAGISSGDANGDGAVDAIDYAIWRAAFGNKLPGSGVAFDTNVVPEQTSLLLLALGLVGLLFLRRVSARSTRVAAVVAGLAMIAQSAQAQSVSLSLNVFPTSVIAPNSGGSWVLVAKTNSAVGISSIDAFISSINTSGITYGPGINAELDGGNPYIYFGSPVNLLYFQDVTAPGLVLGVGTSTFSQALSDPFGDPSWNASTKIAMGTYGGTVPGFAPSGSNVTDANLFTSSSTPANGIVDANTSFVVRIVSPIAGDYNVDGSVDASDYVVWRKNNTTNNALQNDNGLGTPIGPLHYNLWRSHFGQTTGSGSGTLTSAAVPEPASAAMLVIGMLAMGGRRWAARS